MYPSSKIADKGNNAIRIHFRLRSKSWEGSSLWEERSFLVMLFTVLRGETTGRQKVSGRSYDASWYIDLPYSRASRLNSSYMSRFALRSATFKSFIEEAVNLLMLCIRYMSIIRSNLVSPQFNESTQTKSNSYRELNSQYFELIHATYPSLDLDEISLRYSCNAPHTIKCECVCFI